MNNTTNSNYNGQIVLDENLIHNTSPNLVTIFNNGLESLRSKLSDNTSKMFKSSETLGSPRPIDVSGEDLELASNLFSTSENPFSKEILRMEVTNSE